ncbi:MAG: ester cyclase [Chloroflexota bacterium]
MSLEQDVQKVRLVYDYFNAHNSEGLMSLVTDDFELVDMALGMTWKRKKGWGEWLQMWVTAMPDAALELMTITPTLDRIVTEHIVRGTHTGTLAAPMLTLAPTGKRVELSFANVNLMKKDKIKLMRVYWDTGTLMRQLGLVQV